MTAAEQAEGAEVQSAAPERGTGISARTRRQVRRTLELLALGASYPLFATEAELQRPGDTISELAGRQGMSWSELIAACGLEKPRVRVKARTVRL